MKQLQAITKPCVSFCRKQCIHEMLGIVLSTSNSSNENKIILWETNQHHHLLVMRNILQFDFTPGPRFWIYKHSIRKQWRSPEANQTILSDWLRESYTALRCSFDRSARFFSDVVCSRACKTSSESWYWWLKNTFHFITIL